MRHNKQFKALGIMSGTSLDGVDLALCSFIKADNGWVFTIEKCETIAYSPAWLAKLDGAHQLSGKDLILLHNEYGNYLGELSKTFLKQEVVDCVASHGHTLFHQPNQQMTFQLGNGANIAAVSKQNVVCDFRTTDVALGGNGAPLVPIGDKYLFPAYKACINLGGFANVSFLQNNKRVAFDICPANMLLNTFAKKLGKNYDHDGILAASGKIDTVVLAQLNALPYYQQQGAKSLGKEWFDEQIWPVCKNLDPTNALRTAVEHIAIQIAQSLKDISGTVLCTGGGAHNSFLMQQVAVHSPNITIPNTSPNIIDFKEALIFAFLGVLNLTHETNVIGNATGSNKDHIAGAFYHSV